MRGARFVCFSVREFFQEIYFKRPRKEKALIERALPAPLGRFFVMFLFFFQLLHLESAQNARSVMMMKTCGPKMETGGSPDQLPKLGVLISKVRRRESRARRQ